MKKLTLVFMIGLLAFACKKESSSDPSGDAPSDLKWTVVQNELYIDGQKFTLDVNDVIANNKDEGRVILGTNQYTQSAPDKKAMIRFENVLPGLKFEVGEEIGSSELELNNAMWDFAYLGVDDQGNMLLPAFASYVNKDLQGSILISQLEDNPNNAYGMNSIELKFDNLLVSDVLMSQGTGTQGTNTQGTPTINVLQGLLKLQLK